ncbi:MAG: histidine phosphatase family protein [Muribaculaceae bacterium]|jgi:hypothetical protein|nr:histidine phosphatase family protein [Muribaculaceae bacterium]
MRNLSIWLFLMLPLLVMAQTSRKEIYSDLNKAGGVYYAYPVTAPVKVTPAPKGYEPFYISHYGRHGSRYLIGDNDYESPYKLLVKAQNDGVLTPLGKDALKRLISVYKIAKGRGGDLSPLGVRQHRGIAERMFKAYPQVFAGNVAVDARSTMVVRCVLSMSAFCERLKELNPNLRISRDASNHDMNYLCHYSREAEAYSNSAEYKAEYKQFDSISVNGDSIAARLFSNADYVKRNIDTHKLIWSLYWLAVDMQDIDSPISFYDLFSKNELFNLWQVFNFRMYSTNGNYAGNHGLMVDNARYLLSNIVESADSIIAAHGHGATLRFGHDGNIIPLAAIMQLNNCYAAATSPAETYKLFSDFKIAPMAGNVQLIFFRNSSRPGDILVKFLLNEQEKSVPVKTDCYPFYHWKDVRSFFTNIINKNVKATN